MENKYCLTHEYLCGDVVSILLNKDNKQVACSSDYHGAYMGNHRISSESFESLVERTTGRKIKWEWDELYQVYFPWLED